MQAAEAGGLQAGINADAALGSRFGFAFDNSYARELEGLYAPVHPAASPAPRLLRLNTDLASELGLDARALASADGLAVLAGNQVPAGAQPIAQAYAGHQFGGYSPQLGDGRALLLGELIDRCGRRRDIALKGSGRTVFSRGGDGKAALGPVLREYLIGEAMHALGIPTTRALAAVATGESVVRDGLLPGALLTRVAASHVRVGTFQFAAAQADGALLKRLADHVIQRHDPALAASANPYLGLLAAVVDRQAALVARWMAVGFIHGVMNTDNMTVSGETIDYGPCAFMEAYDPGTVFSSIDRQGRYAYGNQPGIAQWNLTRLAEALLPLIDAQSERAIALATEVLQTFAPRYQAEWLALIRAKLGLDGAGNSAHDQALADDYLALLQQQQVDFTLGFRRLNAAAAGDEQALRGLFGPDAPDLDRWLLRWHARAGTLAPEGQAAGSATTAAAAADAGQARQRAMARANPVYIARNHLVEAALAAAVEQGDLAPFDRLLAVLAQPHDERAEDADLAQPAPVAVTACYKTFCGT